MALLPNWYLPFVRPIPNSMGYCEISESGHVTHTVWKCVRNTNVTIGVAAHDHGHTAHGMGLYVTGWASWTYGTWTYGTWTLYVTGWASTLRDGPLRYGMASLLNLRPDAVFYGIVSLLVAAKEFTSLSCRICSARSRRVRDVLSPFRGRAKYPRPTSAT